MDPELLKRIDALAEKVGQTGERLFASLVRREVVSAWAWLVVTVVVVAAGTVAAVKSRREIDRINKAPRDSYGYRLEDPFLAQVVFGLSVTLAALLAVAVLPNIVTTLLSPDASALKTLLGR